MKRVIIAQPPNPDDAQYQRNALAFNRAMFQWAADTKAKLEIASRVNDSPLSPPFVVGTYSSTTTVAGTTTGTDLSNFVCSFVAALTTRGFVTPN